MSGPGDPAPSLLPFLYDTASDLTAIRDVDAILAAIVRRARQLLHCDMTYLSLNDDVHRGYIDDAVNGEQIRAILGHSVSASAQPGSW